MEKTWSQKTEPDPVLVRRICRKTGLHPITAGLLVNRGLENEDDIAAFLNPSISRIDNKFFSLKDMDPAVDRIARAVTGGQKILVFGDFDVDGVTSAAIVCRFLRQAGAEVTIYIPHRVDEGYGLRPSHVTDVFVPKKIDLVITTDCGSSSHEAVARANEAGIDVVITDHHDIDTLPPACAVVNPKRKDCHAGLEHLAGVGVAFGLLICLRKHLREIRFWETGASGRSEPNLKDITDLVAIGTIADVVPLVRENRIIVKTGLDVLNQNPRCGIRALVNACSIKKPLLDAEDLAFRLSPRLNAAGRLEHAMSAIMLLDADDDETAAEIAVHMNTLNTRRQGIEQGIQKEIKAYLAQEDDLKRYRTIVLAYEDWHRGVLGIVASRLAEAHCRPVVLFTIEDGNYVGSARSITGIDLFESLSKCAHLLDAFGGHAMAAGLTLKRDNFSAFRLAFDQYITDQYPEETFVPVLEYDCILNFDMITDRLADEIFRLAPFGEKNPEPLFAAEGIAVPYARVVGGKHLQMSLSQTGSKSAKAIPAIAFNIDPQMMIPGSFEKIAFRLRWNHYKGKRKLQLLVEAMR